MTGYWSNILKQRASRRRALALSAGALSAAAVLAACGSDSGSNGLGDASGDTSGLLTNPNDSTKEAKRGGTHKFYIAGEPSSFDVHLAINPLEAVQRNVYARLTMEKPGYQKPSESEYVGDMAESWEWSPDRLQLTFKLRPGVKWHNRPPVSGRTFDSSDVIATWERFTRSGASRSAVANVANPNAPIVSVSAPDANTAVVKLKYPFVDAIAMFGQWITGAISLLPKETDSTFDIRRDLIGTGPLMLDKYTPSVGFTLARNPDYWDKEFPLIDKVEMPLVSEYAAAIAQFKAGNIHDYPVRAEDILTLKRETPDLAMYRSDYVSALGARTVFGWQPAGKSPFNDERVRQAMSMSYDRDLYLETFQNISRFRGEGLPVDTRWTTHVGLAPEGWWLDPQGKDFGPNAKYYVHDIAEAKKLLAAGGYPDGLDTVSSIVKGTEYGVDHQKQIAVLEGMASEAGFRIKPSFFDYTTEFIPRYRDALGNFEGIAYKIGAPPAGGPVPFLAFQYWSKGGANFYGFDPMGKGDNSGDPYIDQQIEKAQGEIETPKRQAIVHDIQRYLGKSMYAINAIGGSTGFTLAWPAVRNYNVYQGGFRQIHYYIWIDETLPPYKKV
jgi:peptide/nickel transport system substrate-binding protein